MPSFVLAVKKHADNSLLSPKFRATHGHKQRFGVMYGTEEPADWRNGRPLFPAETPGAGVRSFPALSCAMSHAELGAGPQLHHTVLLWARSG